MKLRLRSIAVFWLLAAGLAQAQSKVPSPLFSPKPIWVSGSTTSGGDGNARWIDVDRDGDRDLVTSVPHPRRWAIFVNARGQLASQPSWQSHETTDCDHIFVLDFNRDGWEDLAATHESHCALYLHRGTANGFAFAQLPDWETGLYTDANQIDFGDFDQDGDMDMLMASGLPLYGLALFENHEGTLSRVVSQRLGPREYSESAIFADFDADGDLDIIATYGKRGTVFLFENKQGRFGEGTLLFRDETSPWCQRVYCVDIDHDGHKELFCAKGPWGPPAASIAFQQPAGAQALQRIWTSGEDTGFHGFDFADLDGDGDLDLAAADWAGRRVSVFLQQDGAFATAASWSGQTSGPAHEVACGDVDGDGDLDLAVGGVDQAQVFENLQRSAESP